MPFVGSVVIVGMAVAGLGLVAWRLAAPARRFTVVREAATTDIGDRVRMLIARAAALRVRIQQRRA